MNNILFFSVIIPCYNVEKTLKKTIKSVLEQTCQSFEIILINDGSQDGTLACAQYFVSNYRNIHILDQKNKGVSAARNAGIRHAKGEYLAFLDADDQWEKNKLEKHLQHLKSCAQIGVSYARVHIHDPRLPDHRIISRFVQTLKIDHILGENLVCTTSNLVVKKTAMEAIGLFHEELKHAEDQEWLVRAVSQKAWEVRGIHPVLVHYQTSIEGLSSNLEAMEHSWLKLMQALQEEMPKKYLVYSPKAKALFYRYLARRALRMGYSYQKASHYLFQALHSHIFILFSQPRRTGLTLLGIFFAFLRQFFHQRTIKN